MSLIRRQSWGSCGLLVFAALCGLLLPRASLARDTEERPEQGRPLEPLRIGDAMPAIGEQADWLQGEPVLQFEKGQIYVLDFWATWCVPCIQSMPESSRLAGVYAPHKVAYIGIAIDSKGGMTPQAFLQKKPDLISFNVCADRDNALALQYLGRTGVSGIPTLMIVNRDGVLAWIGHPSQVRAPLAEIVLGTYDLAAAVEQDKDRQPGGSADPNDPRTQLLAAMKAGDARRIIAVADEILEETPPERKINILAIKAKALYNDGQREPSRELFRSLLKENGTFRQQVLCSVSEFFLTHSQDAPADNLRMAIEVAEAAVARNDSRPWAATGVLVLALDMAERQLAAQNQLVKDDRAYFEAKLQEHAQLRKEKPPESSTTKALRKQLLGES